MNIKHKHLTALFVMVAALLLGSIILSGCKKEPEPAPPTSAEQVVTAAIEQTTCPVMVGNKINKNLYTEYKGKKVYFCCPGCKPKFEADPEKYLARLPQFND